MMKVLMLFLFLCLPLFFPASAEETLPVTEFLRIVRTPPGRESWGILEGQASHRRRGGSTVQAPIRFAVLFTPANTIAQLFFDRKELYNIGQSYLPPFPSSLETKDVPLKSKLGEYGIRPEDLTMNFIFWKFSGEQKPARVRGADCRVLDFESASGKESVRVSISRQYYAPMKVEWFRTPAREIRGTPFRTLEVASFSKSGDLWVVGELNVSGPGWRTVISFPNTKAGLSNEVIPARLFLEGK